MPRSLRGMVPSPHHLASQAGLDVPKEGGTAVEPVAAMAACLAVVYPHMSGIGGNGFWPIAEPGGPVSGVDACGLTAFACIGVLLTDSGFRRGDARRERWGA